MSIFDSAERLVSRTTKKVSRTAKKIPGVGHVLHAGEDIMHGPVGRTLDKALKNPILQTAYAPIVLPAHLISAGVQGGVDGAVDAAKQELRNPVRRAAIKVAAVIFPPAAPAAVGLEAANRLLDAAESKDPVEAAKAAASLGAIIGLSDAGDIDAQKTLGVVNQAKKARETLSKLPVSDLTHKWVADTVAHDVAGDRHADFRPARLRNALNVLHASTLGAGPDEKANEAAAIVGQVIGLGTSHMSPFFVSAADEVSRDLQPIARSSDPKAKAIMAEVERHIMTTSHPRQAHLNGIIFSLNGRHGPGAAQQAKQHIDAVRAAHARHDPAAGAHLFELKRRAAALKKAQEYVVDAKGMVVHRAPAKRR